MTRDANLGITISNLGIWLAALCFLAGAVIALAGAGVPMDDMVSAGAVGKVEGHLALGLSKEEDKWGDSDNPIAFASRNGEVLLYQMDGQLTPQEVDQAMTMGREASKKVHAIQTAALRRVYERAGEVSVPLYLTPGEIRQ